MEISVYFSTSRECYYTVYDFPNNVDSILGLVDYHNRMFVWTINLKDLKKNRKYFNIKKYKEPIRKRLGNILVRYGYLLINGKKTFSHSEPKKRFPWWLVK